MLSSRGITWFWLFSFFGAVIAEPYTLGTIKPVKVTWQEDPRFQDSSSESDDEPETSEIEKDQEMQVPFVFIVCLVVVVGCCGHINSSTQEMGDGHCTPLSSESHLGKPFVLHRVKTPSSPFDVKLNMKREKLSTRN